MFSHRAQTVHFVMWSICAILIIGNIVVVVVRTVEDRTPEKSRLTETMMSSNAVNSNARVVLSAAEPDNLVSVGASSSTETIPELDQDKTPPRSLTFADRVDLSNAHFRNTRWGMSLERVKVQESAETRDHTVEGRTGTLRYTGTLGAYPVEIIYDFVDEKLRSAGYYFDANVIREDNCIEIFTAFKSMLIERYHEPAYDDILWKNEALRYELIQTKPNTWVRKETDKLGAAVKMGHLEYTCGWFEVETAIHIALKADNFQFSLVIMYFDNEYINALTLGDATRSDVTGRYEF